MKNEKAKEQQPGSALKELNPRPVYIQDRLVLWDKLKAKYDAELAARPSAPIKVTLPDGKQVEAVAWQTTVYDVAKGIRFVSARMAAVEMLRGGRPLSVRVWPTTR